jgi:hypothetical protein
MSRRSIQIGRAGEHELAVRARRGEASDTIARSLGKAISARTVRRRAAKLRNQPAAVAPAPARSSPDPARVQPTDERKRLLHQYARSNGHVEAYPLALAISKIDRPDFARWVANGESVPEALSNDEPVVADLFGTADGLAHLARHAADGEDDERSAAIVLLEAAIKIVKAAP